MVNISIQDAEYLKKMGYTEAEIQQALKEIEADSLKGTYNQYQNSMATDPRQNSKISSFATGVQADIVKWQLELNDILERAEHILRGDIPKFKEGHIYWETRKINADSTLNEYGVQEIMKILAMYVNRNTILSDYDNEEINFKVFDFGREMNNLIFMRYISFGMDTEEKRKNYPMLVREMVDIVHSSYKRALNGAEKRSLREMITISQNTQTNAGPGMALNPQGQVTKERGLLNPMRIIKGKYV